MELTGQIRNGVVVFDGAPTLLPEGTAVTVTVTVSRTPAIELHNGFPVVRGGATGMLCLTNEQIGELFDEEDGRLFREHMASSPASHDETQPVRDGRTGTVDLTNEMINDILVQEEVEAYKRVFDVPS